MRSSSRRCTLVLALLVLFPPRCVPSNVGWLPDSSGVVFTDREGTRLIHYDFQKKARRTVVADLKACTPWPAVSPDGKQVAVALRIDGSPSTLEVIIFNLDGTEAKRSSTFKFKQQDPAGNTEKSVKPTALFWAASANKILVVDCHGGLTFIFDPIKDRFTEVQAMPYPTGNTPVRPDGKGFLALASSGEKSRLVFIDWDGRKSKIKHGTLKPEDNFGLEFFWEKGVANLVGPKQTLAADTEKRTATRRDSSLPGLDVEGKLISLHTFPQEETLLCVYQYQGETKTDHRIEVQKLADKKRKVLIPQCDVEGVFPSPDRRLVAIRYTLGKTTRILVVDSSGDVIAEIDVADSDPGELPPAT